MTTTMTKPGFQLYNANPMGNNVNDCSVRAISKATGKEWDEAFKGLCEIALELKTMPNDDRAIAEYLSKNGFIKQSIPSKRGVKKPTVKSFAKANPRGTFLLRVSKHIVTVIDGVYYDTWDCGNKSVYSFYEIQTADKESEVKIIPPKTRKKRAIPSSQIAFNKTSINVPKKYAHMINDLYKDGRGYYWCYANKGYYFEAEDYAAHIVIAVTQNDMLSMIRSLQACDCDECQN